MRSSVRDKEYWAKILPALAWQVAYLAVCNSFGKYTRVYCDCVFYLGLAVYFTLWHDWSLSEWGRVAKQGKAFWVPTLLTAIGMAAMFGVGTFLAMLFPGADDGMGVFGVNSWPGLIAFAFTTIFLPPIAEELFYRKAIMSFDTTAVLAVTTIVSILLYASEHSLTPLGFAQACLWAVPLSVAYIVTKNIYVSMTAHLVCNLAFNGVTAVMTAITIA